MSDSRDIAIVDLADREVELLERMASLEADARTYRELARQAIQALHDAVMAGERLRKTYHLLRDDH